MPPDENVPLTLDSALSLMSVKPAEETPPADTGTPAAAEQAAATNDTNSAPADETPPANEDTPADQGETTDEGEDQGDALPLIEAPSSWSTEEKAEWKSLSRKAQETIQRREQDSQKALRTAQNSTAESNKKVEAEVTRLKGIADNVEIVLNEKMSDLARDFPNIKSEADLVTLSQTDPGRYSEFQARLQQIQAVYLNRKAALDEVSKKEEVQKTEELAKAKDALIEAFPNWKDPEVARREVTELQDYAVKNGASEAAARATLDPVIYKMVQKAMLYDRAEAARKAALVRTPPRQIKPGANNLAPKSVQAAEARRAQLGKLEKSGDIEDARGLLRA